MFYGCLRLFQPIFLSTWHFRHEGVEHMVLKKTPTKDKGLHAAKAGAAQVIDASSAEATATEEK